MKQHFCCRLVLLAVVLSVATSELISNEILELHKVKKRSISEEVPLPRHLTPNSYKLELQPFLHEGHFRGKVEINIICHEDTKTIVLHADKDLQIVYVDSIIHSTGQWDPPSGKSTFKQMGTSHHYERTPAKFSPHSVTVSKIERNSYKDWYKISLTENLRKGMFYMVKLEFLGNITMDARKGLYRKNYSYPETGDNKWYIAAKLDEGNARKVFPCFDEPTFKANIQLSIALPSSLKAISTMPVKSTETSENQVGWKLDHFGQSPPMSVQSLGFIIFDPSEMKLLMKEKMLDVTINGYGHPSMKEEFESKMRTIVSSLYTLQKFLGISYPLPELNFVFIPAESYAGHNNNFWGTLILSQSNLRSESFFFTPLFWLPRQWFGFMLTPDAEAKSIVEGLQIHLTFMTLTNIIQETEDVQDEIAWSSYLGPEIFNAIQTGSIDMAKTFQSAWMWRMLNYTLTEETFKLGLFSFVQDKEFKTFTADDLYDALNNQAWLDGVLPLSVSVRDIAKSWTDEQLFPIVRVARNYESKSATITQHAFVSENRPNQTQTLKDHLFWVPIMYLTEKNLDVNSMKPTLWMKEKQMIINDLPDQDMFIIVNPELTGMYLVNYDQKNWNLLSQYLLKSTTNRSLAQIPGEISSKSLYDAMTLAMIGELDFPTALDMTLFLRHERNPNPWIIMNEISDKMSRKLHDTYVYDKFLVYKKDLFVTAYKQFEHSDFKGEFGEMLMKSLTVNAAEAGYEPALTEARREFALSIGNNTIPTSMSICGLLRWSDDDWELALKYILTTLPTNETSNENYFADLVWCNRKPEKLNRILYLLFIDDRYEFSNKDAKDIFYAIHDYTTLLKFIDERWNNVKSRYGNNTELWNLLFEEATKDVKSEEGLKLVSHLYEKHNSDLQSAKNIVEKSLMQIQENINGKYKYVKEIDLWLDSHLPSITSV